MRAIRELMHGKGMKWTIDLPRVVLSAVVVVVVGVL